MKKLICLILCVSLLGGAALGEGAFGQLFDAAVQLAFETSNVSLSAEATFTYDGEVFKVMHAAYQQDGVRSFLSYMLDTPDITGNVTTNGFIVHGLGDTAYAGDTYYGYYYDTGTVVRDKILKTNPRTEKYVQLARMVALSVEDMVEQSAEGNTYHFTAGRLPENVSMNAFLMVLDYVYFNYYRDLYRTYDYNNYYSDGSNVSVETEDWMAIVEAQYKKLFDSEMPSVEEIYDDETLYGRYSVAVNAANQVETEAKAQYDSGLVYIKADGSIVWYASEEEYMRQNGKLDMYLANWDAAFKNYYKIATGEEITDETMQYVLYSPNEELWSAYNDFMGQMSEYYTQEALKLNPSALTAVVMPDGTIKTYNYIIRNGETMTERIFRNLDFAELEKLDADVTVDDEGRLTAFKGSVTLSVLYKNGENHTLDIDFDCKAENYGTTSVPQEFEPEKYNLVSHEEYEKHRNDYEEEIGDDGDYEETWKGILENDPGTITFLGKTYETLMDQYDY